MEDKPKGDAYTMSFIERKGGVEEVARKTKMNRQTVRQVATGRNAPSFDFVKQMMATYPTYDIRASIGAAQPVMVPADDQPEEYLPIRETGENTSPSLQVLAVENVGLRNEIALLKNTVRILEQVVSSQLGKSLEQSKTESSNEPTQIGQLMLDLTFGKLKEKRFIPLSIRDALGVNQPWMNRPNS